MTRDPLKALFAKNRDAVIDNLEAIQIILQRCTDEGMLDLEEGFHNELLDLLEEANICKTNAELAEVITKAQTLETDVEVWLSTRGQTTISLTWPTL